jgi:hypothetical protein
MRYFRLILLPYTLARLANSLQISPDSIFVWTDFGRSRKVLKASSQVTEIGVTATDAHQVQIATRRQF